MDLKIKDKLFIVCGATSGFGKSIAIALIREDANVIAIARGKDRLIGLEKKFPDRIEIIAGDITKTETILMINEKIGDRPIEGILLNAEGPPAKSFIETKIEDWDNAYDLLLRWKVVLIKSILPKFIKQNYGRILFTESSSVKQPIENLILSTSLRLAVVGFAKTLSQEIADKGITVNVMAPGFHETPAIERVFKKKSQINNITVEEARRQFEKEILVGKIGNPDDFASLAVWLLSPLSNYVTGQTFTVDGGSNRATLG